MASEAITSAKLRYGLHLQRTLCGCFPTIYAGKANVRVGQVSIDLVRKGVGGSGGASKDDGD